MNEYFRYFKFDKRRDLVWQAISEYLQRYIARNAVVLDIGAGYCNFINNIYAKEKHAVDKSNIINSYADRDVITHITSCTHMREVKSNYFDAVFCSNLLEHLNDSMLDRAIKGIKRVLKADGLLILLQPNFKYALNGYFDDYTHRKIFTDISIRSYLSAERFEVIKIIPKFLPLSMNSGLPKSKFLTKLYLNSPVRPFAKQMLVIARLRRQNS